MLLPKARVLSRWQAAGLHLLASSTVAALAGLLLFGVWYPSPYTQAAGADRLIMLLIGIDLVLGPLLTLIVYKHGKKGMAFDIAFIASVQLAALVYGMLVISESRPVFVVVAKDMTYLTMASSLSDEDLAAAVEPRLRQRSWTGPVQVAAPPPETAEMRQELLDSGLGGKDIDRLPKYFRPMDTAGLSLIEASTPLQRLADVDAAREAVQTFVAGAGIPIEQLRFQPLRGRNPEKDSTIVYALGATGPVGVIEVDPWPGRD
jgi:hypothetical protein